MEFNPDQNYNVFQESLTAQVDYTKEGDHSDNFTIPLTTFLKVQGATYLKTRNKLVVTYLVFVLVRSFVPTERGLDNAYRSTSGCGLLAAMCARRKGQYHLFIAKPNPSAYFIQVGTA